MRPVCLCQHDKIGINHIRADDAPGILPFLVHADGAVGTVVDDDDDNVDAILHRGRELLAGHHEVAVAGYRNHAALGIT